MINNILPLQLNLDYLRVSFDLHSFCFLIISQELLYNYYVNMITTIISGRSGWQVSCTLVSVLPIETSTIISHFSLN